MPVPGQLRRAALSAARELPTPGGRQLQLLQVLHLRGAQLQPAQEQSDQPVVPIDWAWVLMVRVFVGTSCLCASISHGSMALR